MIVSTLAASTLLAPLFLAPPPHSPPPARQDAVVEVMHGVEVVDEYRWLEALEDESEEVRSWTTLQNDYTRSILDHLPLRDQIESRLAELMTVGAVGSPTMAGIVISTANAKATRTNRSSTFAKHSMAKSAC